MQSYKIQHAVDSGMGNGNRGKGHSRQGPLSFRASFYKQGNFLSAYTGVRLKVMPGPGDFPKSIVESCSQLHFGAVCV